MHFRGTIATFISDQRVFKAAMIQPDWFSRLGKEVNDGRTAEPEHFFADRKILRRPAIQQKHQVNGLRRRRRVEQITQLLSITARVKTQIEKQILLRKRKILLQQHVSRMRICRIRQDVGVQAKPDGTNGVTPEIDRLRRTRNLQRDVIEVAEQQFIERLDRNRFAVQVKTQAAHLEVLQLDRRRQAFKSHLKRRHHLRLHVEETVVPGVLEI